MLTLDFLVPQRRLHEKEAPVRTPRSIPLPREPPRGAPRGSCRSARALQRCLFSGRNPHAPVPPRSPPRLLAGASPERSTQGAAARAPRSPRRPFPLQPPGPPARPRLPARRHAATVWRSGGTASSRRRRRRRSSRSRPGEAEAGPPARSRRLSGTWRRPARPARPLGSASASACWGFPAAPPPSPRRRRRPDGSAPAGWRWGPQVRRGAPGEARSAGPGRAAGGAGAAPSPQLRRAGPRALRGVTRAGFWGRSACRLEGADLTRLQRGLYAV